MPIDEAFEELRLQLEAKRAQQPQNSQETPLPPPPSAIYRDLEFQHLVPYEGNDKELFTVDAGLHTLRQAGFHRYPRPSEAFSLIIDGIEGKLQNLTLLAIHRNMFESHGEWLSLAFERRGDVLLAYVDPELVIQKLNEPLDEFPCTEVKRFTIIGKPSNRQIDLKEFDDEFVQFMYGRPFTDLPPILREGNLRARVVLPYDGTMQFVGRYCYEGKLINNYGYVWASRGVRPAQTTTVGTTR